MKRLNIPCKILHAFVVVCVLVYGAVQYLKFYDLTGNKFILHHLNDLMILPIALTAALNVVWLLKKDQSIRLGLLTIICAFALYSIYFEYYLPNHMERYTADIYDVLCYAVGAGIFYALQKLP